MRRVEGYRITAVEWLDPKTGLVKLRLVRGTKGLAMLVNLISVEEGPIPGGNGK